MAITNDLASLIRRAQRQEADAFDALVDLYAQRLFGFLFRMTGNRDDADELVQEVFVRVVRTLPDYVEDGRFEPWLFRIATNLGRDRARRRQRMQSGLPMEADGDAVLSNVAGQAPPAPDDGVPRRVPPEKLEAALAELPDAEREVVLLRHYTDMSFAEIAEMMGTPLGTALARAHRGLAKLRRTLESEQ